jgi:dGTPase
MRFESDRGRIINSALFRRLPQKNQVFPLEINGAVRSRLTHSLVVQQVIRFLVQSIYRKLKNEGQLEGTGLELLGSSLESLVEMSCLMHDIGAPPFGHFAQQEYRALMAID